MKTPRTISLVWRDENYGHVSRALAFRPVVEPYPSDTAYAKLARLYRRCGFIGNQDRGAWIAQGCRADAPAQLVEQLVAAGYAVEHQGCFASLDEAAASAARLNPPRPSFDHAYERGAYGVCRRCGAEKH